MLETLQRILANLGIHIELNTFLVLFGLIMARMAAAISLSPFLGGKSVSGRIKVGLAIVVSMLLFPNVAPHANLGDLNVIRVMGLMVKEGLIGATLGFLSQLVFQSIQMAGASIDYARGMSQATFLAPELETNVSLIGQLQLQASIVLFLLLNGHLLYLRALAASFRSVPLLEFPKFGLGTLAGMEQMGHYTASSLTIALQLAAPALLTLFLVDISFGMIGKVASGLRVHTESQPVKALLGLSIVFLGIAYIVGRMPEHFTGMLLTLEQFMRNIQ
ncbi:MAG TPA: flagellar biosynthetic protein FliR [Candidatus Sulfotelmatobacter sp.]|jgi:flagellar biosynthetic protein FliR|nr:flagellar biosynthetic protein FliR [Candidatus Sulfotelmatobacter sp.]